MYITYKNEHAHIPATLIELSVLSAINIVFLFLVAIFYLRKRLELTVIWQLTISLSLMTITILLLHTL